jgi:flagellar biosynthesis/type III secretory pathway protein FliH
VAAAEAREREAQAAVVAVTEARGRETLAAVVAAVEAREHAARAGAVAAAESKARDAIAAADRGIEAARQAGRDEGYEIGKAEGLDLGRDEGRREGLEEGRKEGRVEARIEAREEGREEGRLEGRRAGREIGLQEGARRGRDEGFAEGLEKGRREAADAARQAAVAEWQSAGLAANDRLLAAIKAIDAARSLTEVLDALSNSAGREAARVALLLVQSGQLRGWRFIGFGGSFDGPHDAPIPLGEAGLIADAARTGVAQSAVSATPSSVPSFAGLPPGRKLLALPIEMGGQVIAILYADQGVDEAGAAPDAGWPPALELMVRHAARCLEAITAFRAAQLVTEHAATGVRGLGSTAFAVRGSGGQEAMRTR